MKGGGVEPKLIQGGKKVRPGGGKNGEELIFTQKSLAGPERKNLRSKRKSISGDKKMRTSSTKEVQKSVACNGATRGDDQG